MRYQDILLHLTEDGRGAEKAQTALALAKTFGARLTALYTLPRPQMLYYMGEYVPVEYYEQQNKLAQEAAAKARTAFEAAAAQASVVFEWLETDQPALESLLAQGRHADLTVIGQPDDEAKAERPAQLGISGLPADLALSAGRPILVVPYAGTFPAPGKTVLVAWNGSREGARAVHDALPLLAQAQKVIVFGINPDEAETASAKALVAHLQRHGVAAEARHTVTGDLSAGDALLSALTDHGADLLVMGAYGHSRLREMVLGGVTETVLESMTVPVLLAN